MGCWKGLGYLASLTTAEMLVAKVIGEGGVLQQTMVLAGF